MSESKKGMMVGYSGKKFRNYLKLKGLSYAEAADRFGVNKNTISKVVSEKREGTVSLDTLLKIVNQSEMWITDFFKCWKASENQETGENPAVSYDIGTDGRPVYLMEPEGNYKNPKKEVIRLNSLIISKKAELLELERQQAKAVEEMLNKEGMKAEDWIK